MGKWRRALAFGAAVAMLITLAAPALAEGTAVETAAGETVTVTMAAAPAEPSGDVTPAENGYAADLGGHGLTVSQEQEGPAGALTKDDTVVEIDGNTAAEIAPDGSFVNEGGEKTANAGGVYAGGTSNDGYAGKGDVLASDAHKFTDGEGSPIGGLPDGIALPETDRKDKVNAILEDAFGTEEDGDPRYEADGANDYLVVLGDVTVNGDKAVQKAVGVRDENGELITSEVYEITLTADAEGTLDVYAAEGNTESPRRDQDVILVIDVTDSMNGTLDDKRVKWDVLKEAATDFLAELYGLEKTADGFLRKDGKLVMNRVRDGDHLAVTLVIYGGDGETSEATIGAELVTATVGTFDSSSLDALLAHFDPKDPKATNEALSKQGRMAGFAAPKAESAPAEGAGEAPAEPTGKTPEDFALLTGKSIAVKHDRGTTHEAGYREARAAIERLQAAGQLSPNVAVVYMTDGEFNAAYGDPAKLTPEQHLHSSHNVGMEAGGEAAVRAQKELLAAGAALLEKGISLYNIVINTEAKAAAISYYMDAAYSRNAGKGGDVPGSLEQALTPDQADQTDYAGNVRYEWADTAGGVQDIYEGIAKALASRINEEAIIAANARVIDVVPAGFDVYLKDGGNVRVAGKDEAGNTILVWEIGGMTAAGTYETSYFVVPNDPTRYGTAFTNDSAILTCKPVGSDRDVAIVMPRPAVLLGMAAHPDETTRYYGSFTAGNLIAGFPGADTAEKLQAAGTAVGEVRVTNIRAVTIGSETFTDITADPDTGVITVDLGAYGTLAVDPDGTVRYDAKGAWNPAWGERFTIGFEYDIAAGGSAGNIALPGSGPDGALGFSAGSTGSITVLAPPPPGGGGDYTPIVRPEDPPVWAEPIPDASTPTPAPVIPIDRDEGGPLNPPETGSPFLSAVAVGLLLAAAGLSVWAMRKRA